jgi:hypothetical protein
MIIEFCINLYFVVTDGIQVPIMGFVSTTWWLKTQVFFLEICTNLTREEIVYV